MWHHRANSNRIVFFFSEAPVVGFSLDGRIRISMKRALSPIPSGLSLSWPSGPNPSGSHPAYPNNAVPGVPGSAWRAGASCAGAEAGARPRQGDLYHPHLFSRHGMCV